METNKRPTQAAKILKYMQEHGSITTWEACIRLKITRLPARIWELQEKGIQITKKTVRKKDEDGTPVHYTRYYLTETEA